jgi:hypothetical protein
MHIPIDARTALVLFWYFDAGNKFKNRVADRLWILGALGAESIFCVFSSGFIALSGFEGLIISSRGNFSFHCWKNTKNYSALRLKPGDLWSTQARV